MLNASQLFLRISFGSNLCYLRNYYFEYILEDANPDTFKILDLENGLATDGTNDYILDVKIPFELAKAKIISEFYLRIGNDIYCNYQEKLNGVDAESFKIIRDAFLEKMKKNVYPIQFCIDETKFLQ